MRNRKASDHEEFVDEKNEEDGIAVLNDYAPKLDDKNVDDGGTAPQNLNDEKSNDEDSLSQFAVESKECVVDKNKVNESVTSDNKKQDEDRNETNMEEKNSSKVDDVVTQSKETKVVGASRRRSSTDTKYNKGKPMNTNEISVIKNGIEKNKEQPVSHIENKNDEDDSSAIDSKEEITDFDGSFKDNDNCAVLDTNGTDKTSIAGDKNNTVERSANNTDVTSTNNPILLNKFKELDDSASTDISDISYSSDDGDFKGFDKNYNLIIINKVNRMVKDFEKKKDMIDECVSNEERDLETDINDESSLSQVTEIDELVSNESDKDGDECSLPLKKTKFSDNTSLPSLPKRKRRRRNGSVGRRRRIIRRPFVKLTDGISTASVDDSINKSVDNGEANEILTSNNRAAKKRTVRKKRRSVRELIEGGLLGARDIDSSADGRTKRKAAINFMERMKRFASNGIYDYESESEQQNVDYTYLDNLENANQMPSTKFSESTFDKMDGPCGICNRNVAKKLKKYGIATCEVCCSFMSKVESLLTSRTDDSGPIFVCNLENGLANCEVVEPDSKDECNDTEFIGNRCKACWLARCINCYKMPFEKKQDLTSLVPTEMRYTVLKRLPFDELNQALENIASVIEDMNNVSFNGKKTVVVISHGSPWADEIIAKLRERRIRLEKSIKIERNDVAQYMDEYTENMDSDLLMKIPKSSPKTQPESP